MNHLRPIDTTALPDDETRQIVCAGGSSDADAEAALLARGKRVREEARKVKPLVWTPNTDYRVDGLISGDHSGFWTTHKSDDCETWEWADPYGKTTFGFATQALAIAALEAERADRILSALIGGDA